MALKCKGLPRSLYSICLIIAINNYIIKPAVIDINAARKCFIYNDKIVFLRYHTSCRNTVVNPHLLFGHGLIRIIR